MALLGLLDSEPLDGLAPNQMVKRRPHVVSDLSHEDREPHRNSDRPKIEVDAIATRLAVDLYARRVGVRVDPLVPFAAHLLCSPPPLGRASRDNPGLWACP